MVSISTSNLQEHSLQVGFQSELGYQKFFTPFIGISTYGYFSYRYLYMKKFIVDSNVNALNRYSAGLGSNLLFNVYTKIKKSKYRRQPSIQTYGFFAGLLGLFNLWNATFLGNDTGVWRNNINVDATLGFSMRFNRFKWMLGVHIPLANANRTINLANHDGTETIKLLDNYKSADLFLNFVTIF